MFYGTKKGRGGSPRKDSFMPIGGLKQYGDEDKAAARGSTQQLEVEHEEEIESTTLSTPSATPTRSEENLQNLGRMMEDSSGEEEKYDDHPDSEGEDREVMVTEHELEGYYWSIDVGILNQNIASQLACGSGA